jgi:hypothetical protein
MRRSGLAESRKTPPGPGLSRSGQAQISVVTGRGLAGATGGEGVLGTPIRTAFIATIRHDEAVMALGHAADQAQ